MRGTLAFLIFAMLPAVAPAQQARVPFGSEHDASQPVEVTAQRLDLDQANGTALFTGDVRVGQGALRMAADRIEVFYVQGDTNRVDRMVATGNVTLSNGTEAAESENATYEVATGIVDMAGDVLLTQGGNALSGEALRIDLTAGTASMQGRVQTILTPGSRP